MNARRIAIVGAESTGKSWLTQALAEVIRLRGHAVHTVDEVLRAWCDREGRTPHPHEQLGIAQAQAQAMAPDLAPAPAPVPAPVPTPAPDIAAARPMAGPAPERAKAEAMARAETAIFMSGASYHDTLDSRRSGEGVRD